MINEYVPLYDDELFHVVSLLFRLRCIATLSLFSVFCIDCLSFHEFLRDSSFLLPICVLDSIHLDILLCVFDLPNALYRIILRVSLSYLHRKIFTSNLFSG